MRNTFIASDYESRASCEYVLFKNEFWSEVLNHSIYSFLDSAPWYLLNLVFILHNEIKKYISTYRLWHIYSVQANSINKPALNIWKYKEIYIMIESYKKVLPMVDDVNAEKAAEPSVKKDSSKAV